MEGSIEVADGAGWQGGRRAEGGAPARRGAGSVQRFMHARELRGLGVAFGRRCWRGRQLLFSFGRTTSRIVLAALAAALLQRATGFSGGVGPTAFLAPPLRGAPALAGPIWTSPHRATGPFARRQWHAPRALFDRDEDPAQPQDDRDTKSSVTAFRDDILDRSGGPASANGSSGRQERMLSTALAFDNALPYWGWPSLPLAWPANASGPNPFASAGAGSEADTAKAEKRAQSLDEKDAADLKRLRREVEVLRQALQRERSKIQRLRTAQSGAAQSVAAASNVQKSSSRAGPLAGVLSNTGRAISSGATAVVSTPYKWGSAAAGAMQRINVSGVWQATKNTSSKVWGKKERMPVRTVEEFNALLKSGVSIDDIDVRGRSQPWRQDEIGQIIVAGPSQTKGQLETTNVSVIEVNNLPTVLGDKSAVRGDGRWRQLQHPVLRAIWERKKSGSQPGARTDGYKIALAIEGGGLRGSVTAGMSAAVMELGVHDCFDLVLGSSAGSIIGTYLLGSTEARAHQETTYEFFCNHLTTSQEKLNGSSWLDMGRLVDLFTPEVPFSRMRSGSTPSRGLKGKNKPGRYAMMALDYPMKTIMQELLPVNWEKFQERDAKQPMKIIASGLFSEGSVRLGSQEGSFTDLPSLCECIKASCMLPGVAGVEPPWLKGSSAQNPDVLKRGLDEYLEQELETSPALWTQARNAFIKQMQRRRNSIGTRRKASGIQRVFSQSADSSNVTDMPGMNQTEVFAALEDLGLTPTLEELELVVKMSDVNFDGLIDLDEFKGMVYFLATQHLASSQSNSSLILSTALDNKTLDLKSFKPEVEPMVDALLYEPIPYRSAIEQGCTHVLVLRSYPDGRRMPQGYLGLFERLVAPKCLDPFPRVKDYMISLKHSERYSEDILRLNEGVAPALASANEVDDAVQSDDAREVGRLLALECAVWQGVYNEDEVPVGVSLGPAGPHLLAVAPLDTDGEAIRALELDKSVLLRGIMQGFARAYDMLVPDDHGGETGDQVSKNIFLPIHYRYLENLARAENNKKKEAGGKADERVPKSLIDLDKILLPKSLIDLSSKRSSLAETETEGTSAVDGKNAAKLSFWTEGRAGRLIPNHWKPDVNYAFGAHDADLRAGEEVVLRRGDGSLRFARVEAQYQDDLVLVLGPDPNVKPSGKKDKVSAVPFRLVKRSEAGKLLLDDWVPHDEAQPPEDEDTSETTRWWKAMWKSDANTSTTAANGSSWSSPNASRLSWQQGVAKSWQGLGNLTLWSSESLKNVTGGVSSASGVARAAAGNRRYQAAPGLGVAGAAADAAARAFRSATSARTSAANASLIPGTEDGQDFPEDSQYFRSRDSTPSGEEEHSWQGGPQPIARGRSIETASQGGAIEKVGLRRLVKPSRENSPSRWAERARRLAFSSTSSPSAQTNISSSLPLPEEER